MYANEGDDIAMALAGDAILTRKWSVCDAPAFTQLIDTIRDADVSFVNLEVLLNGLEGYPAAHSGGTYMSAPPWIADELTWAGFDLFSAATNHIGDFSHGGMERTMQELEQRNLPYAGLGENLADARAPDYVDTPAGRVGLVAACSTFTAGSEAGQQRPDFQGRPGLSPLRLETKFVVNEDALEHVRALTAETGLDGVKDSIKEHGSPMFEGEGDERFYFFDPGGPHLGSTLEFVAGDDPGVKQTPNETDKRAILDQIEAASRQADWVIASLHSHEGIDGRINESSVPAFLESFAKQCIDAGADAFVTHGSHVLCGIELYDGAPLFYGLGNLSRQNETVEKLPTEIYDRYDLGPDALPSDLFDTRVFEDDGSLRGVLTRPRYWETIVPVCNFEDGDLGSVTLYPVDLAMEEPRPRRGRPLLAENDRAEEIIERVTSLSDPYGTDIELTNDVGELVL